MSSKFSKRALGLILGSASRDTSPHPEPEDLALLAQGGLDSEERARIVDHVAQCARCYQVLNLTLNALERDRLQAFVHAEAMAQASPSFAGGFQSPEAIAFPPGQPAPMAAECSTAHSPPPDQASPRAGQGHRRTWGLAACVLAVVLFTGVCALFRDRGPIIAQVEVDGELAIMLQHNQEKIWTDPERISVLASALAAHDVDIEGVTQVRITKKTAQGKEENTMARTAAQTDNATLAQGDNATAPPAMAPGAPPKLVPTDSDGDPQDKLKIRRHDDVLYLEIQGR